jgi:lipoprotein-anchoring transpeptidase ErfK/SrfK
MHFHRQPAHRSRHLLRKTLMIVIVLLVVGGVTYAHRHKAGAPGASSSTASSSTQAAAEPNACAGNTLSQLILVSIGQQHMWACAGSAQVYDNAVITGMELYPADLTPTGTYHIYAKATDQTLAGHDSTGSWSDFVNYWMPFLDNQYGTYGFHDLTQAANGSSGRTDSDFGNININAPYTAAKHGSHGCVEMPLAAAKWLYGWAPVGTTVTVES